MYHEAQQVYIAGSHCDVLDFGVRNNACSARYVDNRDGTVTDGNTNLVWQKSEDGVARTWANASPYCENLVLGGYADWRLPRVDELASLADYAQYPALDPAFGTLQETGFWSDNSVVSYPTAYAWVVDFLKGAVVPDFQSSVFLRPVCARWTILVL